MLSLCKGVPYEENFPQNCQSCAQFDDHHRPAFVIAVICLFLGKAWVLAVAAVSALSAMLCTNKAYRYPHCNKGLPYISPKGPDAGDCPYCGEKMEFED